MKNLNFIFKLLLLPFLFIKQRLFYFPNLNKYSHRKRWEQKMSVGNSITPSTLPSATKNPVAYLIVRVLVIIGLLMFFSSESMAAQPVSYNDNGSTSGTPPATVSYNNKDTVTVLSNSGNLAKTGFVFSGWDTTSSGTGTTYQPGNTFTMGTTAITLYAKWVAAVNTPPTFTSTPVTTATEGVPYSYLVTTNDDDGDTVTVTATTIPSWLTFDGTTLGGTPVAANIGPHSVVLTASDGEGGTATQSFIITVSALPNTDPTFTSTPITTAIEDIAYSYTVATNDTDGDTVIVSGTTIPSWLSFNGTTLSGTPSAADVGDHSVTLTASDGNGGTATQSFTITVSASGVNADPTFTSTPITTAIENIAYTYTITTNDANGDFVTVVGTTIPSWLDFNTTTLILSGTPVTADIGDHDVNLTASDGEGGTAIQSFTITVSAAPVPDTDLNITKKALDSSGNIVTSVPLSSDFTYIIDVSNNGPSDALNVIVTDTLPSGVDVNITSSNTDSPDWTCSGISGTVTCNYDGDLSSESTITLNVTAPSTKGNITNNVSVTSDNDPDTSNNSASTEVEIVDTSELEDICYANSTYEEDHPNTCSSLTGVSFYTENTSYTCTAKMTIYILDSLSDVNVTKSYTPERTNGSCDTETGTYSCIDTVPGNYIYNLGDFNSDANITILDSDTYASTDIIDIALNGEYTKNGLIYAGEVRSCSSVGSSISSDMDAVDTFMYASYATAPIIQTKISKKDNQQLTAVYIDNVSFIEKTYNATIFDIAPLEAFFYRSNDDCTDELPLAEPVAGSPIGEPVIAHITSGTSFGDTNTFTMKAIANRDTRIKIKYIDWSDILGELSSANNCFNNSNWEGNFNGLPQCLNQLGSSGGLSQEFMAKYPNIETTCLNQPGLSACDSNAYNSTGSVGGITPEKYDHAYGCLACILDATGDVSSCSRDNFAIRPDYYETNAVDIDFPNLLRAGEDYNLTIYAHDFGETSSSTAPGTIDYIQVKSNLDLNQTRYYNNNNGLETPSNPLFGTLVWSAWDFNITDGISNRNGDMSITEVAGVQYDDVGKINLSVEDRDWAAVDINNLNDLTPEDCSPDGAYICGDRNVTYIPHHFGFSELNITNQAGPDSNFTYVAKGRGMPTVSTMPVRSPMAARIQTHIKALTKDGIETSNFRTEATADPYDPTLYYENKVSVTMVVTVPSSGTNMYIYPNANESNITDSYIGFGRTGLDNNGTRNVLWNENDFPLEFNFNREINEPANPFDVNGSYLKSIQIVSHYIDPEDLDTADINGSRISEDSTCTTGDYGCVEDNADNNATFYYGRARASKYFYEDITEDSVTTPITINIYCTDAVNCSDDYDINIVADRTDEKNWYLSVKHRASLGDGNISIEVGSPLLEGIGSAPTISNATDIAIESYGMDNTVEVSRGSDPVLPMTVPLELVQDDGTSTPYTHEWLIYNKDFPTTPSPFYKVRFIGNSAWTGTGITGDVVNIDASRKKSKKMDW